MNPAGTRRLARLRGLSAKTLLALLAAALPALLVATILGLTLVTTVTQAERDFENSMTAALAGSWLLPSRTHAR